MHTPRAKAFPSFFVHRFGRFAKVVPQPLNEACMQIGSGPRPRVHLNRRVSSVQATG